MPVTLNLTPSAIAEADYPIAKTPAVGFEIQVYMTTSASKMLGEAFLSSDGVLEYTYHAVPTAGTPGPIVAVATQNGVLQAAADTITYGGLTGSFTPVEYTGNQSFTFPIGRGVELTGTYVAPTSSSVPTLALGGSSGMLRGSHFALYELPSWSSYVLAGETQDRSMTPPSRGTKNIAAGPYEARWTVPGLVGVGQLSVTGLNQGYDDGLLRFAGVKSQVCLTRLREGRLLTERTFCLDYTGRMDTPYPAGDGEATVTLTGQYSQQVVLIASGGG